MDFSITSALVFQSLVLFAYAYAIEFGKDWAFTRAEFGIGGTAFPHFPIKQ